MGGLGFRSQSNKIHSITCKPNTWSQMGELVHACCGCVSLNPTSATPWRCWDETVKDCEPLSNELQILASACFWGDPAAFSDSSINIFAFCCSPSESSKIILFLVVRWALLAVKAEMPSVWGGKESLPEAKWAEVRATEDGTQGDTYITNKGSD